MHKTTGFINIYFYNNLMKVFSQKFCVLHLNLSGYKNEGILFKFWFQPPTIMIIQQMIIAPHSALFPAVRICSPIKAQFHLQISKIM